MKFTIQVIEKNTAAENDWVSIHILHYHPDLLERLVMLGIITIRDEMIHNRDVYRLNRVFHLRKCLGVNFTGATIIVDLLERIESLEEEIRTLHRQERR